MKIIRINHLGIVPKSPDECTHFFQNILGLKSLGNDAVGEQKVHVNIIGIENSRLEILAPTAQDSPIEKFLQRVGSGIHHIALEVDSLDEWLIHLKSHNIRLIDEKPRIGAHNTKIAFIHPKATGGILVELVES